jgi:hypothetical protein
MHTTPMAFLEWLRRLFRPTGLLHCSFCGASHLHVVKLIGGQRDVFICDGCARQSIGIIESGVSADEHVLTARWEVLRVMQALPRPAPRDATRRLSRAAIALSEGDGELLREVAARAIRAYDHHAALEALSAIPSGERRAEDLVDEAVCYAWEDAPAEAARALATCDLEALMAHDREVARLLLVLYRLRAKEAPGGDDLEALIQRASDALDAKEALASQRTNHRHVCAEARGLTALRRGDLAEAERVLTEAPEREKLGPFVLLALREVRLARGDFAGAVVARLHALEALHPESPIAVRLKAEGKDGPFRSA